MICRISRWKNLWQWLLFKGDTGLSTLPDTVPLGDLLSRIQAPIDRTITPLCELNVIAKITFGGELHIRPPEKKLGYKGPLFRADPGDLIISKIRVAQGSLCIVPKECGHVAVSNEYPVYRPDLSKVDSAFLSLLLRTSQFQSALGSLRSGNTTKARLRPVDFEALPMPFPEIEDQRRLVAAYQKALDKAAELESQALQIERDAQREFEAALGLTPPPNLPKRPFQIARFRDIERWSHEGILQALLLGDAPPESRFEIVQLGDIATVSYGLQKCPSNRPDKHARPYLRVANVQRNYLDLREIKTINVPDTDMPKYRLEDGDILLCEGNSADLVGQGAIWKNDIDDCVHQNHVLRVRLDRRRAVPEFILGYINSPSGQTHFRSKAKRTTNLASINSKEVANLAVPLPEDTATQVAIVRLLRKGREAVASKRKQASELRMVAWNDFITAVFT
jgi:type I restriction enzyme, S subunit